MLRCLFLGAVAIALGGCEHTLGNDDGVRYLQRKDTVTFSAGDAKEVNARTHMLTPWPWGVNDRRILANGSRMARAVECYEAGPQQQGSQAGSGGGLTINVNGSSGSSQGGAASQAAGQQGC